MKLATYKDGSRDGQLVVVSRDLASAHYAVGIATRLQQVLDDWNFLSPQLQELSQRLNHGKARHAFPFDPALCMAPLPRAFAWVDADDGALVADLPRLRRGPSDAFLAPHDVVVCGRSASVDVEARLAAVVGDVEAGVLSESALEHVRLLMLAADVVHRAASGDVRIGTAFSPVAATPDELAPGWRGGRLEASLEAHWNGRRIAAGPTGAMDPAFGDLVAVAARRGLAAGGIVGSGPLRVEPKTAFIAVGDVLRLDLKGAEGQGLLGAIVLTGVGDATEAPEIDIEAATTDTPV